jgi:hypothetical protein
VCECESVSVCVCVCVRARECVSVCVCVISENSVPLEEHDSKPSRNIHHGKFSCAKAFLSCKHNPELQIYVTRTTGIMLHAINKGK